MSRYLPDRRSRILVSLGIMVIAATWLWLVITRPDAWGETSASAANTSALITLVGYVLGAGLLLAGTIPVLPSRTVAIIPMALVLNIVVGEFVGSVGIPLYLDSVGTVLIAALTGPATGMATGALSSIVWGLINPTALPFAAVSAAVGWLSGVAMRSGALEKKWKLIVSGALVGIICGMLSAPVAAFVYGGTTGVGTGAVVSLFREIGASMIESVTLHSMLSDPLDKIIVFAVVAVTITSLPKRVRRALASTTEADAQ